MRCTIVFSGAPVVFTEPGSQEFRVAAVISGYEAVREPIMSGDQKTQLSINYNTGIVTAHTIDQALALIESNPNGVSISTA